MTNAPSPASIALSAAVCFVTFPLASATEPSQLTRIQYNHPGLACDVGVGLWAWPLPMDYDEDGDLDLVVSCPDAPHNGTYFFENPGSTTSDQVANALPIFKPPVKIAEGLQNIQVSYVDGLPRVLCPGAEFLDFRQNQYSAKKRLPLRSDFHQGKVRANQWKYVDFNGDGLQDLLVGIGDWADYGWDNAFDHTGKWTRGPLHGYIYVALNRGTNASPEYEPPFRLQAADKDIDVYGMPSPNLADFDNDGDLDLLCGEFLDRFTYFENIGSRSTPRFREGRFLKVDSQVLRIHLCMMVAVAVDWDHDGDMDLVVGQEDGRVMFIEHTGHVEDGMPVFNLPQFFQQEAAELKFGVLATPVSFDWDNDGDEDLLCGNSAGEIGFVENLNGKDPPQWAKPKLLEAEGKVIRIQAGENGSIQGPCEAKWGYTTLCVADWDHDGLPDIVVNSIWGKVEWYKNVGSRSEPKLAAAMPIEVQWDGVPPKPAWNWWNPAGNSLATQWRTTPVVVDLNRDGLNDLVMLDCEGYLACFERARRGESLVLLPPKREFCDVNQLPLRLADLPAGKSGRRKLCLTDWDNDGIVDLLANSQNVQLFRGVGRNDGSYCFDLMGDLHEQRLAGHTTCPTVVDWDKNGVPDLLVGAEDGCFYYLENPRHP